MLCNHDTSMSSRVCSPDNLCEPPHTVPPVKLCERLHTVPPDKLCEPPHTVQGLDFLPVSDGFKLRHPDEDNVRAAVAAAEADSRQYPQGQQQAAAAGGDAAAATAATASGRGEEAEAMEDDGVLVTSPFVGDEEDVLLLGGLEGDAPPGEEDEDEADPDLFDTVAPKGDLDAGSRLLKQ